MCSSTPSDGSRNRFGLLLVPGVVGAMLSLTLAPGCAVAPPPKPPVAEVRGLPNEWVRALRSQQMIPIYPLHADLRPGDVFASSAEEFGGMVPLDESGNLALRTRLVRLLTDEGSPAMSKGQCVFPTLTADIDQSVAAKVGAPVAAAQVGLSLLGESSGKAMVSLGGGEIVQVDQARLPLLYQDAGVRVPAEPPPPGARMDPVPIPVQIITAVYYITSIDVIIRADRRAGGSATASASSDLKEYLSAGVSVLSQADNSIALRQTFAQPVAVGYVAVNALATPAGLHVVQPTQRLDLFARKSASTEALKQDFYDLLRFSDMVCSEFPNGDQAMAHAAASISTVCSARYFCYLRYGSTPSQSLISAIVAEFPDQVNPNKRHLKEPPLADTFWTQLDRIRQVFAMMLTYRALKIPSSADAGELYDELDSQMRKSLTDVLQGLPPQPVQVPR